MNFFTLNLKTFSVLFLACFFSVSVQAQCDNITSGGAISADQSLPQGVAAATLISNASASGGSNTPEYLWMMTTIPGAFSSATWLNIPGATGATYDPGVLSQTTYFIRCARNTGCTQYAYESNIVTINITAALPVDWTSFTGKNKNGSVVLDWTTASETNHSHFLVEYSTDGHDFEVIGEIQGNGIDSRSEKTYSFTDKEAQAGANFYRLLQVDMDGKETYSEVVSVTIDLDLEMSISPNPAVDFVAVKISELSKQSASLVIYSAQTGQLVKNIELNEAQLSYSVTTDDLAAGLYIVHIQTINGDILSASKFMKANR